MILQGYQHRDSATRFPLVTSCSLISQNATRATAKCAATVLMTQFFNIYEKSYCVAPFLMAHHQVGRRPMHIGKMIVIIKSMKDRNQRSRSRLSRSKHAHSIIAIVWSSPRMSLDMDRTICFWLLQLGEDLATLIILHQLNQSFKKQA